MLAGFQGLAGPFWPLQGTGRVTLALELFVEKAVNPGETIFNNNSQAPIISNEKFSQPPEHFWLWPGDGQMGTIVNWG